MTYNDIRSIVVECLKKDHPRKVSTSPFRVECLFREIAEIAKVRDLKVHTGAGSVDAWSMCQDKPELHPRVIARVWSVVWDLIIEGILRPGTGTGDPYELPNIHVTEYGKSALKDLSIPHDPDGYLKGLSERVPKADPVIMKYIAESAETLRRNCLLSSTVTLGCASEKAFLLLMEAYKDALNPADKAAFTKALEKKRTIKLKHEEFKGWYDTKLKAQLKESGKDRDWLTMLENALMFMFSYFRDIRNEAGHPTGVAFQRELVQSHLVIFPVYLKMVYEVIEWIDKNKPL